MLKRSTKRPIRESTDPIVITRDNKLRFVSKKLKQFSKRVNKVYLIGLSNLYERNSQHSLGIVPQEELFTKSKVFLQLDGYGEGIPHSLVDAICSEMDIIVQKSCWIKYGFYKYTKLTDCLHEDFYFLHASKCASIRKVVTLDYVNQQYLHNRNLVCL